MQTMITATVVELCCPVRSVTRNAKRTLQYNYHAAPETARVLLGLHGNSTEGFLLKNLYCIL